MKFMLVVVVVLVVIVVCFSGKLPMLHLKSIKYFNFDSFEFEGPIPLFLSSSYCYLVFCYVVNGYDIT